MYFFSWKASEEKGVSIHFSLSMVFWMMKDFEELIILKHCSVFTLIMFHKYLYHYLSSYPSPFSFASPRNILSYRFGLFNMQARYGSTLGFFWWCRCGIMFCFVCICLTRQDFGSRAGGCSCGFCEKILEASPCSIKASSKRDLLVTRSEPVSDAGWESIFKKKKKVKNKQTNKHKTTVQ